MIKFFIYKDNNLEINKEELYLIPSAMKLVHADKGSTGDVDGRKKLLAKKKFGIVWWIIDINSPGVQAGLEGDPLVKHGIESLDMNKTWDYKNDKEFQAFLSDYKDMYESASYALILKEILIAFADSAELIRVVRKQVRKKLDEKVDLDADDINMLTTAQNQIIKIASEIPSNIKKIKELQIIVAKEEKEQTLARGDKKVTSSMRPDS